LRIISGTARGKRLAPISGSDIRPTPDRVREALFSILGSRFGSLAGLSVLDLFAGSGALALEALSRGAASAVLVDQGSQAAKLISANIRCCALENRAHFIRSDVLKALAATPEGRSFDLIFLDPPYGKDLVPPAVLLIAERSLLAPAGLLCAETDRGDKLPEVIGSLRRIDERHYGSTTIHLYTHPEAEART